MNALVELARCEPSRRRRVFRTTEIAPSDYVCMSILNQPPIESSRDHKRRLAEVCPMGYHRWRFAKAMVYSLLVAMLAVFVVYFEADPTIVGVMALATIAAITIGEVREIQIAQIVTVTFKTGRRADEVDRDDRRD